MNTHIIINGREVTNPVARFLLILGTVVVASLVIAVVLLVLLPLIGVAVTLSLGFILIFVIAIMAAVAALVLITVVSSWLFGSAELRVSRRRRK